MEMAAGDSLQPLLPGHPLRPDDATLAALAKGIGHAFARPELAAEALTHRSALDRQPALKAMFPNGNERLEFLGDRVLSLAMANLLLRHFPQEREGELARRHNALVSAGTLVEVAEAIGLGRHVVLGASEKGASEKAKGVKPAILADAFEALLGAIFLDAGFEAAAAVIERLFGDRLAAQRTAPRDPKTELQEWAQARRLPLPRYREVGREGPVHEPVFVVEVTVRGQDPAQGRGGAKREAERLAAAALLERLAGT
jgi:ribonuclease III